MGEVWRLFATIIAMTDTGSIAMTNTHSDWPTWDACKGAERLLYSAKSNSAEMAGRTVELKIATECVGVKLRGEVVPLFQREPIPLFRGR